MKKSREDAIRELAQSLLEWETQFGPSAEGDLCEVAGEDMALWARLARTLAEVKP